MQGRRMRTRGQPAPPSLKLVRGGTHERGGRMERPVYGPSAVVVYRKRALVQHGAPVE